MKRLQLYQVRFWEPKTSKIKTRFFIKNLIVLGSDKTCDLKHSDLEGLHARLDFRNQCLLDLQTNDEKTIEEGELFQVGELIFQWSLVLKLPKSAWLTTGLFGLGVLLLLTAYVLHDPCTEKEKKIASGNWQKYTEDPTFDLLSKTRASALDAMKSGLWVRARGELNSIKEIILPEIQDERCGCMNPLENLEARLSLGLSKHYLKQNQLMDAVDEVLRWRERRPEVLKDERERFLRQILRQASRKYVEGYRLEDEDSERGRHMMEEAHEVCDKLGLEPQCFRLEDLNSQTKTSAR